MKHVASLLAALVLSFWISQQAEAQTVPAGWDLLTTQPGATFFPPSPPFPPGPGIPFTGVPLSTFDFGGGPVGVGSTDTIVERLVPASGPGIDTIPIEMVSLQLVSAVPIDLTPLGGAGVDFIGVTLQSDRGRHGTDPAPGLASTGTMDIDFDTNTFESDIGIAFDLREGGVFGPILPFGSIGPLLLSSGIVPWESEISGSTTVINPFDEMHQLLVHPVLLTGSGGGPPDVLILPGVNEGFFPGAQNLAVPEPSGIAIWSLLALALGVFGWVTACKK